jgi:hypothetical protein
MLPRCHPLLSSVDVSWSTSTVADGAVTALQCELGQHAARPAHSLVKGEREGAIVHVRLVVDQPWRHCIAHVVAHSKGRCPGDCKSRDAVLVLHCTHLHEQIGRGGRASKAAQCLDGGTRQAQVCSLQCSTSQRNAAVGATAASLRGKAPNVTPIVLMTSEKTKRNCPNVEIHVELLQSGPGSIRRKALGSRGSTAGHGSYLVVQHVARHGLREAEVGGGPRRLSCPWGT